MQEGDSGEVAVAVAAQGGGAVLAVGADPNFREHWETRGYKALGLRNAATN